MGRLRLLYTDNGRIDGPDHHGDAFLTDIPGIVAAISYYADIEGHSLDLGIGCLFRHDIDGLPVDFIAFLLILVLIGHLDATVEIGGFRPPDKQGIVTGLETGRH